MRYRLAAAAALALAAVVASWMLRNQIPEVEAPPRGATISEAPLPDESVLLVDIEVPYDRLAESIEESVPPVFLDEQGQALGEGGKMLGDLHGERTGPVVVGANGDQLRFELPVLVTVKLYGARKAEKRAEKGKDGPAGARVQAKLVVETDIDFELTDDWTLVSTASVSHRWVDKPTIQWGPIKLGIEGIADKTLTQVWEDTETQITANMNGRSDVREGIERAWVQLGTPRQTEGQVDMWWLPEPTHLYASQLVPGDDALHLTAGARGRFRLVLGEPETVKPLPALPARTEPPAEVGFRLALPVSLSWQAMSDASTTAVAGQSWELPIAGTKVGDLQVDGIELYPSGERIAVAIDYSGANPAYKTDGKLYLTGRPVLDTEAQEVRIEDFAYAVDTWDGAVAGANALTESTLAPMLADRLVFPFADPLEQARKQGSAALTRTTDDGGEMRGALTAIDVRAVRVTDAGLVVDTVASGVLTLVTGAGPAKQVGLEA